jgi:lipoprotein NlpD
MRTIRTLALISSVTALASCGLGGNDENYDTGGAYDTSDPYGLPNTAGTEGANYEAVNPPADANPTYGAAAYEETAPIPATPPPTASTHTVVKGDTLWGLSQKYNVSQDDIRAANGMAANETNIRLGQSINIPAR